MFTSFASLPSRVWSQGMLAESFTNCTINGQVVDCGSVFAPFMALFGFFFGSLGLLWLAIVVLNIIANWKIYQKAGQPGWASIIPIYNMIVLLDIVGRPRWWVILMFVPLVNFIIAIIVIHRLALSFGKDVAYTIGLVLLGPIFFPILAFSKAQYNKLV